MANRRTTSLFVIWIAAITSLCLSWGFGEGSIQNVVDGAADAKQTAFQAVKDAQEQTNSWLDSASQKFTEKFELVQGGNVKDGSRRLMSDAKSVASEANDAVNAAVEKSIGNNNLEESHKFTVDKLGGAYDFASKKADHAMKSASEMASNAAQNPKEKLKDGAADAISYANDKGGDAVEKSKEMVRDNSDNDIIKMVSENGNGDSMVGKLQMGENDNEEEETLMNKYEGAKSNVKETYRTAKETMKEKAKESYEAAKENASQITGDLGKRIKIGEDL